MSYKLIAALALSAIALPCDRGRALANPHMQAKTTPTTIVLRMSDLRSAFLIRDGAVRYDVPSNSPESVRAQLQRHFDVVLGLLLVSTRQSIETALTRLEESTNQNWSSTERNTWRQKLLAMRYLQLRRLAAYRDRRQFPLNDGHSIQPAPIFVDAHDTACAVGQLMRWSGWQGEVEVIRGVNNLVYVPDVPTGPIARWVLTSGITIEEAALVQPGYPTIVPYNFADYGPGALISDGLRYENLQLMAENYNANTNLIHNYCSVNACDVPTLLERGYITPQVGGTLPNASAIGFQVGTTNSISPGGLYLIGTNWIVMGGRSSSNQFSYDRGIQGAATSGHAQRIVIQFDLSTTDTNKVLSQLTQHSNYFGGSFHLLGSGSPVLSTGDSFYSMTTHVLKDLSEIGSTALDRTTPHNPSFFNEKISTINFSPQQSIRVQTELWLVNGVGDNSFGLDFRVGTVPEPNSACLAAVTAMAIIVVRRARNGR
jgi:hypothetical protein